MKLTYGDKIKLDERVLDKIERGFYYSKVQRKKDFENARRMAPSQYLEELRRLNI